MTNTQPEIHAGRLIRFSAENVLKIKAVEITLPDQPVLCIGGNNGAGKSSIFNAIVIALGGAGLLPDEPIRDHGDEGKIVLEFEDIIVKIKLVRSDKGDVNRYLVIESKDGKKYPSPQALLDKLTGKLSFDPVAFMNLPAPEQKKALQKLVGLDFSALDAEKKDAYDKRTFTNRLAGIAQGKLTAMMPHFPDAPKEPVSVADIQKELDAANVKNAEIDTSQSLFREAVRVCDETTAKITELEKQLNDAKSHLALWTGHRETRKVACAGAKIDVVKIADKFTGVQARNKQLENNNARAVIEKEIKDREAESKAFTVQIDNIDTDKEKQLKAASFPIDGMGFNENGVTFNGLPFSQASDAEKIAVSTAMGLSLNPKLKLLLVRNGSLLDNNLLGIVSDMAAQAGAQVLIERVGDGKECQVIIADGTVKEIRG